MPELNLPGDAVGNDVAGMYKAIVQSGSECVVFTAVPHGHDHIRSGTFQEVKDWLRKDDLLIYQYASGGQEALKIVREAPCATIVRYHNVTPGHFFRGVSAEYERTAEEAQDLLKEFLSLPQCRALSASSFSNRDLSSVGLPRWRSGIVPPFHVIDELLASACDEESEPPSEQINLLTVGRIAPNKRVEVLLDCLADVVSRTDIPVRLTVIGDRDPRLQPYLDKIDDIIGVRHLDGNVDFRERVSTEELADCYRQSDIFVTCSGHEGFCVPAIEAMAFGLPVVATAGSALPETCGDDASILCAETTHFTTAILRLIGDRKLRGDLGLRGRFRYRQMYTDDLISREFRRNIWRARHPFFARLHPLLQAFRLT